MERWTLGCKDVDPLFTNYACGQSTRVDVWLEQIKNKDFIT